MRVIYKYVAGCSALEEFLDGHINEKHFTYQDHTDIIPSVGDVLVFDDMAYNVQSRIFKQQTFEQKCSEFDLYNSCNTDEVIIMLSKIGPKEAL